MTAWPEGVGRHFHDRLDSTMAEAARLAPDLAAPTWIHALEQSAGRGRRGRGWVQPPGNFSATLIWRPGGDLGARAQRSFVAALALFDALVSASGRAEPFTLKWPNDVLLDGRKLAGILLESLGDHLAIGFGVNLEAAPEPERLEPGALAPVSFRSALGLRIAPADFLDLLAPAYAAREAAFVARGFGPIRQDWLARAAHLGQPITARIGEDSVSGIFETVDAEGRLVLNAPEGRRVIAAADIHFTPP